MKLHWKKLSAFGALAFIIIGLIVWEFSSPLIRGRRIVSEKHKQLMQEVTFLLRKHPRVGESYVISRKNLPKVIKSINPLYVWVEGDDSVVSESVVNIQLTAGFYHTGLLVSNLEISNPYQFVPYPCSKVGPNVYQYKGIIAENY